ncbi:MAG: glycogen synthase GlgA [Betaproteobacteria bacterium]|nr:MAG: glycogen synthase GlgA [Betaproteobacteria bacterium]
MRVLFVTPECAPLTKTGGLGDVSAALPAALRAQGIDVRVLLPRYREIDLAGAEERARLRLLGTDVRLLEKSDYLLIDAPALYDREGSPYQDGAGEDWPDNWLRFGVLSRAAALLAGGASPLEWRPEILHCNDWPTALAPVYLHFGNGRAGAVMTVHNLAFQGIFDAALLERLELPPASFAIEGVEFYGRLSFLKGGLVYADAITTVSPTYAREIQGEEAGCGLDGVLRERRGVLRGIVNGIDAELWNPMNDALIAERYSWSSLERKGGNKAALQRRLNLAEEAATPLLGTVCRFTHQKGIDLLCAAADELLELGAQVCVLGRGEREHETALAALAARHPQRIGVAIGFNEELAHLIEAGADLFLMPSRFEPCGLNQMYSQRYGTPPVARATGGLVDTIADGETGFLFERAESAALVAAVRRALEVYREPRRWRELQRRGMARDFSWSAPARQYADLYARHARAPAP